MATSAKRRLIKINFDGCAKDNYCCKQSDCEAQEKDEGTAMKLAKVLIWIGCLFMATALFILIGSNTLLGFIPTIIIYGAAFYIARQLCAMYEEKKTGAIPSSENEKKTDLESIRAEVAKSKSTDASQTGWKCVRCGTLNASDFVFCKNCGMARVSESKADSAAPTPSVVREAEDGSMSKSAKQGKTSSVRLQEDNEKNANFVTNPHEELRTEPAIRPVPSSVCAAGKEYAKPTFCTECGKKYISHDSMYCAYCGAGLADDTESPNPIVQYCRKCGKKLHPGAVFCDKCGTRIVDAKEPQRVCNNCGNVLNEQWKYCGFCGRLIESDDYDDVY